MVRVNGELANVISELSTLESNKLFLLATLYTRKTEEIKEKKLKDFDNYFNNQITVYKRSSQKYEKDFENLKEQYENAIDNVIKQYCAYYQYLQNEIVFAQSNQKIAIANFVASKRGLDKARGDRNFNLVEKSNKKIYATAQKKLNYDVVINECDARLEECIEEVCQVLNEIFNISGTQISKKTTSFIDKFILGIKMTFRGEKIFRANVLEPLRVKINTAEKDSRRAVSENKIEMLRFIAQMERIRSDINLAFNETLNKDIA